MSFWTPDGLRAASAGAWVARPREGAAGAPAIDGLSIDTRTIRQGEAFLAIRGERFDGHDFLADAVAAGASTLIVDRPAKAAGLAPPGGVVKVADASRALLRLAAQWRRQLDPVRVIGVTGSNGKTTTTRLLHAVLSRRLRGSASQKSFNNAIGVPLTILRAKASDQFLVAEVGINAPGEMAELAETLRPDIGVITSIGRAHIEALGSVEGICREKSTLLRYVEPGGCCVVTADAPQLVEFLKAAPNVVTFGRASHADLRLTDVRHNTLSTGALGLRFTVNDRAAFELPLIGEHNALNALAAIAVARRLGLDNDAIAEGLLAATGPDMRLSVRRRGAVTVLNDAYNANPDSCLAALRAFAPVAHDAKRRIFVWGDMLELGDHAAAGHDEVADAVVAQRALDLLVAVGPSASRAAERVRAAWGDDRVLTLPNLEPASLDKALAAIRPGDAVLLKGSRGMALERLDAALERRAAEAEPKLAPAAAAPSRR